MSLMLLALLLQNTTVDVTLAEGGFCTGPAWIDAAKDKQFTSMHGPDFNVYRHIGGAEDSWGVYSGRAASVSSAEKKRLLERDGVTVDAVSVDGRFRGYLASFPDGEQNHFFGAVFKDGASDRAFFDRVDFGATGRAKCAKHPPR